MARGVGGGSPAEVVAHLEGVDFPARKQDLVEQARNNGTGQDVMRIISRLPWQQYDTMADVTKAYGEVKAA